jgi:drug/metabolite transporter (DMT)-like permease
MPLSALLLLLAAAVAHASWNYLAKGARNDLAFQFAIALVSTVIYLPLVVVATIVTTPDIDWRFAIFVAVSGVIHTTYFFLLTQGYRVGDLSLVYPLARGTGPVLATIGAIIIYDERPGPVALLGTAMVVTGILIMTWTRDHRGKSELTASIVFALATGACTAVYTLWDKTGVGYATPLLYGWGIDAARTLLMAPIAAGTRERRHAIADTLREQRFAALGIGILTPAAYILVLAALDIAPVSYVAPFREISILIGALLGLRLLRESDPLRRLIGASLILAGIFALALG